MKNKTNRTGTGIVFKDGKPVAVVLDIEYYKDLLKRIEDTEGLVELEKTQQPNREQARTLNLTGVSETALLSEPALGKDWNRQEEDEAWSHLQPEP